MICPFGASLKFPDGREIDIREEVNINFHKGPQAVNLITQEISPSEPSSSTETSLPTLSPAESKNTSTGTETETPKSSPTQDELSSKPSGGSNQSKPNTKPTK
jgi:hypothetical protein